MKDKYIAIVADGMALLGFLTLATAFLWAPYVKDNAPVKIEPVPPVKMETLRTKEQ